MVQKTIEIMSFGALPMMAPPGPVHTVPRKRRPRAAGEVFITSHSNVYFVDPKDVSVPETIVSQVDPIYENTVNEVKLCQRKDLICNGKEKKVQKRNSFCSVRVSMSDCENETQQVSAFIGKII